MQKQLCDAANSSHFCFPLTKSLLTAVTPRNTFTNIISFLILDILQIYASLITQRIHFLKNLLVLESWENVMPAVWNVTDFPKIVSFAHHVVHFVDFLSLLHFCKNNCYYKS